MNISINKARTASFDVDPQNGFTPVCPNELPVPDGTSIVAELNAQADKAALRVVSKDAHPAQAVWKATDQAPQFSPVEGGNVDIRWEMHCVPGTPGFELIEGLPQVTEYDYVVYKGVEPDMHPYGACYHDLGDQISTGVIEYLKCNNIETVICGGLATDYCVKLTALQLRKAGFNVIVNIASCRGITPEGVEQAIQDMKAAGIQFVDCAAQIDTNE